MYTMGLDIGSTASKGVILEDGKKIIATSIIPLGTGTKGPAKVLEEVFGSLKVKREDIDKLVVTGYGRMKFKDADKQLSELSCHAMGVAFLVPEARTVIDIGGQDAKVLSLDEKGKLMNFVMNDKCAAGTGRFLDIMAKTLDVEIDNLGKISKESKNRVAISSTCTVFAESEVISHLSNEVPIEDIIAGIHESVAKRVSSLAKRLGIHEKVVMVGGVARNEGVVLAMEEAIGSKIIVPDIAQLTGALGASIEAYRLVNKI